MVSPAMSHGDHTSGTATAFSLTDARLNKGLSIRQAAQAIEIAQGSLARLEKGEAVHPSTAKKVADFFKVQVTDLMPESASEAAA